MFVGFWQSAESDGNSDFLRLYVGGDPVPYLGHSYRWRQVNTLASVLSTD